jgi:hypothetical protein
LLLVFRRGQYVVQIDLNCRLHGSHRFYFRDGRNRLYFRDGSHRRNRRGLAGRLRLRGRGILGRRGYRRLVGCCVIRRCYI